MRIIRTLLLLVAPPLLAGCNLTLNVSDGGVVTTSVAEAGSASLTCDNSTAPCIQKFPNTAAISLLAEPAADFYFSHWEGSCQGINPNCNLVMNSAKSVKAVFNSKAGASANVDYISPYVAYTNTVGSDFVIVRGSGFTAGTPTVTFDTQFAANVRVINDTTLEVTPPTLAAGEYHVTVSNSAGAQGTTGRFLVKNPPKYTASTLLTSLGNGNGRVIYDAEREALYVVRCYICDYSATNLQKIVKYTFNKASGQWQFTLYDFPFIQDLALTPDGQELIAITRDQIFHVDPLTFKTKKVVNLPARLGGIYTGQMVVTNNGIAIIRSLEKKYSIKTSEFSDAGPLGDSIVDISLDGSRAVVGDSPNSSIVESPFRFYDAYSDEVVSTNLNVYNYGYSKIDMHGNKLLISDKLYDRNFNLLGTVPLMTNWSAVAPDGKTAYGYNFQMGRVDAVNLVGLPPFTVNGYFEINEFGNVITTQDGGTVFIVGANYFMVRPVDGLIPLH